MGTVFEIKDLLNIEAGPDDRRLQAIVRAAFGTNDIVRQLAPLWNAQFFGLNKSSLYRELSKDHQLQIVMNLSQHLLTEAYAIEKIGMGFTAKMSLLANTLEERMLYSAFAFDEASHFHHIAAFLDSPPTDLGKNPFLKFLAKINEDEEKEVLVINIQVMLEGWGMSHYRLMYEAATDAQFQNIIKSILKDEALHHGTGIAISSRTPLTAPQKKRIYEIMSQMLNMVRAGPQSVVHHVELVAGHLSRPQKLCLLQELETEGHASTRLQILKNLIPPECSFLLEELTRQKQFQPYTAAQCLDL